MLSRYPFRLSLFAVLSCWSIYTLSPLKACGTTEDQVAAYLSAVDLHLDKTEEYALKRRIVADGIIDSARIIGEDSLNPEDRRALKYLTRPVCARDERNPSGQTGLISAYCPNEIEKNEIENIFSSMGLDILRQWSGVISTYYILELKSGIGVVEVARNLEKKVEDQFKNSSMRRNSGFYSTPNIFSSGYDADEKSSCTYISDNRVGVRFVRAINSNELLSFSRSENLILLNPQINYESIDSSWVTREAVFFIAGESTVGEAVDQLYHNTLVRDALPDAWITLDTL